MCVKSVRRFDKHQRLGGRFKVQLAGVIGVVQPQGKQRAAGGERPGEGAVRRQLAGVDHTVFQRR